MMNDYLPPFDKIWDVVICRSLNDTLNECDPEFVKYCSLSCNLDLNDYKVDIENYYLKLREEVKKRCYHTEHESNYLDYRKIAAILCETFIAYKPFGFDIVMADAFAKRKIAGLDDKNKNTWLVNNLLINYKAAYSIGLAYIFLMMLEDMYRCGSSKEGDSLRNKRKLFRYPKGKENDAFDIDFVLELARIDQEKEKLNPLILAYTYFQIDMFNRLALNQIQPI